MKSLSCVQLFATPQTVALQAPPSMGFFQARILEWGTIAFSEVSLVQFSSVQSLSRVRLFATPRTEACQASLFVTNSWSLLKLMLIELVMPSTISTSVIPFSSHLQYFPAYWYPTNTNEINTLCLYKNPEESKKFY